MESIRRSLLSALIPVIVVVGIIAVIIWGLIDLSTPYDDAPFSVVAWQKSDYEARGSMCGDLIRSHIPEGTPRDKVVSLLGLPDHTLTETDPGGNRMLGAEYYAYLVGPSYWRGFDDAFLYVHFDESGKVIAAEVNGY